MREVSAPPELAMIDNAVNQPDTPVLSCHVCGRSFPRDQLVAGKLVRPAIAELIRREHPQWSADAYICFNDLHRFHWEHVEDLMEQDRGELTGLEKGVLKGLRRHELLTADVNAKFETQRTLGDRVADAVAAFGGSWTFIISFGVVLAVWVIVNTIGLLTRPFDPYPYILLNLVLSCLAALQAPVIMMSQNRQEAKDRLRSEHDYRINLKAELEIRHLHHKIDHILNQQWNRLIEIQELQLDLMSQIAGNHRGRESSRSGQAGG
jgi:uncharacterized membrane protein